MLEGNPVEKIKQPPPFLLQILRNLSLQIILLKSATLAFAVITLYFQDLRIIFTDALQNEANSYILFIPILFGYLTIEKGKYLPCYRKHKCDLLLSEEDVLTESDEIVRGAASVSSKNVSFVCGK